MSNKLQSSLTNTSKTGAVLIRTSWNDGDEEEDGSFSPIGSDDRPLMVEHVFAERSLVRYLMKEFRYNPKVLSDSSPAVLCHFTNALSIE